MKTMSIYQFNALAFILVLSFSCKDDTPIPEKEDTPELITKVSLQFSSQQITGDMMSGESVVVSIEDSDGIGPNTAETKTIILAPNTTYTLSVELINTLYKEDEEGYFVSEEVKEEGAEHQFFYAFTENLFTNPTGNGNIDNRDDAINYVDKDENGLPIGLQTTWTTGAANADASNTFHVLLQHQPNIKSATSSSSSGETDLDVTFDIRIEP